MRERDRWAQKILEYLSGYNMFIMQAQSPEDKPIDARDNDDENQAASPIVRELYASNECVRDLPVKEPSAKCCTSNPRLEMKTTYANNAGDISLTASETVDNNFRIDSSRVETCVEITMDSKDRGCRRADTERILAQETSEACDGSENEMSEGEVEGADNNDDCSAGEKDGDVSTSRSDVNSSSYQSGEDGHEDMERSVMLVMHQALCNSIRKVV